MNKKNIYPEIKVKFSDLDMLNRLSELADKNGISIPSMIRKMIDYALPKFEEENFNDEVLKSNFEVIKKELNNLKEQNRVILDRQLTSRVYDKSLEKICSAIYQYMLVLIPFATNRQFEVNDDFIQFVLNNNRPELAAIKNNLLHQLVQGSDLLDKDERDVK